MEEATFLSNNSETEEPEGEERKRCWSLPLPTRWSRRVRQSSASLREAGTSGAGKGMAGKQTRKSPETHYSFDSNTTTPNQRQKHKLQATH